MGGQTKSIDVDALIASIRAEMGLRAPEKHDAPDQPDLSTDEIMRRVRIEVAHRHGRAGDSDLRSATGTDEPSRPAHQPTGSPAGVEFVLADLLVLNDVDFVEKAYQVLLQRGSEPAGRESYLNALRHGQLSKIEVLAKIRWSVEGRARSVPVPGLMTPYLIQRVRRLPVLRPVLEWVLAVMRLPNLQFQLHAESRLAEFAIRVGEQERRAATLEESIKQIHSRDLPKLAAHQELNELRGSVDDLKLAVDSIANRLGDRIDGVSASLNESVEQIHLHNLAKGDELKQLVSALVERFEISWRQMDVKCGAFDSQFAGIHDAIGQLGANDDIRVKEIAGLAGLLSAKATDDQVEALSRQVATQRMVSLEAQRRLGVLIEEVRRKLPAAMGANTLHAFGGAESHQLDSMYANFEEQFRGTRDEIKTRALHYLKIVRDADAGSDEFPIVDLGCGRGEWLDLLREHDLRACGVDVNEIFLADCRRQGLNVVESDVVEYLRELPDHSIGAITSMHLVEHLSMDKLVNLIDESFRVLRPGGVIALETPNPENLLVSSHYFYLDPTHRNPLPPTLLQWLVQTRGFDNAKVDRLGENRASPSIEFVTDETPGALQINFLVSLLRQPPDYAVIARKAAETPA